MELDGLESVYISKELTGLPRFTSATITNPERLKEHLMVVRARGYAIDNEEAEESVRCIGAPIFDHKGEVNYSISIAGPAYRVTLERIECFIPDITNAAYSISRAVGYAPKGSNTERG
jgi:IclR family KDG regulon transcriptional repressor